MLGSPAGGREVPGDTEVYQGRQFKVYRGILGSLGAIACGETAFQQNNKLVPRAWRAACPTGPPTTPSTSSPGGLRAGMELHRLPGVEELHTRQFEITSAGLKSFPTTSMSPGRSANFHTLNPQ